MLPIITLAPIPAEREVSESRLAATWALDIAPKGKAPDVMRKVACICHDVSICNGDFSDDRLLTPYLTVPFVVAKNMMYPA